MSKALDAYLKAFFKAAEDPTATPAPYTPDYSMFHGPIIRGEDLPQFHAIPAAIIHKHKVTPTPAPGAGPTPCPMPLASKPTPAPTPTLSKPIAPAAPLAKGGALEIYLKARAKEANALGAPALGTSPGQHFLSTHTPPAPGMNMTSFSSHMGAAPAPPTPPAPTPGTPPPPTPAATPPPAPAATPIAPPAGGALSKPPATPGAPAVTQNAPAGGMKQPPPPAPTAGQAPAAPTPVAKQPIPVASMPAGSPPPKGHWDNSMARVHFNNVLNGSHHSYQMNELGMPQALTPQQRDSYFASAGRGMAQPTAGTAAPTPTGEVSQPTHMAGGGWRLPSNIGFDQLAQFHNQHDTIFDPASSMDRNKMQGITSPGMTANTKPSPGADAYWGALFKHMNGSAFDPNSHMDRAKMQAMMKQRSGMMTA